MEMSSPASSSQGQQGQQSALKALAVLSVLMRHFAHGLSPGEIATATGLNASGITRCIATLEQAGYAERIPETGRIRPSVRIAQQAIGILADVERAKTRLDEIQSRLVLNQR